jgi:hypothetical protein
LQHDGSQLPQQLLQSAPFEKADVCASAVTPRIKTSEANAKIFFMIQSPFDVER